MAAKAGPISPGRWVGQPSPGCETWPRTAIGTHHSQEKANASTTKVARAAPGSGVCTATGGPAAWAPAARWRGGGRCCPDRVCSASWDSGVASHHSPVLPAAPGIGAQDEPNAAHATDGRPPVRRPRGAVARGAVSGSAAPEEVVGDAARARDDSRWKRSSSSSGECQSLPPRPSSTGATATCRVSTRSASRNSRTVDTPPPRRTSLPSAASLAWRRASCGVGVDEVEGGVRQRDRGADVVGEHEHRRAEGRIVAPPALPVEVLPRPLLRAELAAAHDLGADVVGEVAGEVVVEPRVPPGSVRPASWAVAPAHDSELRPGRRGRRAARGSGPRRCRSRRRTA